MRCKLCGRPLKGEKSIEREYGPGCWKKVASGTGGENGLVAHLKATISDPVKATETRFKLMDRILDLKYPDHVCSCGEPIKNGTLKSYDHPDGGVEAAGYAEPQWFYSNCPRCNYDYALRKLRIKMDDLGEKVDSENVLSTLS